MIDIVQTLYDELYTILFDGLSLFPFLGQSFYANGIETSFADLIATFITLGFLFFVLFIPIWFVYKVVKRWLP